MAGVNQTEWWGNCRHALLFFGRIDTLTNHKEVENGNSALNATGMRNLKILRTLFTTCRFSFVTMYIVLPDIKTTEVEFHVIISNNNFVILQ